MQTRPLPPHWLRTDALVALALAALGCGLSWLVIAANLSIFSQSWGMQCLGTVIASLPLVWRRRFPLVAGMAQAVLYTMANSFTGIDIYTSQVVLFLGFYSIGAWSSKRGQALLVRILICLLMGVSFVVASFANLGKVTQAEAISATQLAAFIVINSIVNVAFFTGAWTFGDQAWDQAMERAELDNADANIKQLQAQLVAAAIEEERLRIARELHDVVAHHVTAMSVQAAAARRLLEHDPGAATASLIEVESSARAAVRDLRSMVLTLRDTDDAPAPEPTLADLAPLVATARNKGQRATYEEIGTLPELTPAAELALYRAAQEGLTNAAKHAGPHATVHVRLRGLPDAVELEVADDGRGTAISLPGTGTGLTGMRERIAAVGGTLEAGPKPRGGFRIRATIPAGAAR
ncbi:sensor histidine kinase [uncultured Tessaracoccus sp.]|uniref:sensor histidine kinase n=1 Tax=uncultured Tessaracoccus sp. TaxID=905023 RepID=UPI00261BEC4B|nr:sensor histidine kinase [uncultured Tessaracoccus sp.]